jgi:magnesium-transporting ATPase (P-type)
MDAQREPYYALPRAKALERFEVSVSSGLTVAEAVRRLKKYGPNTIVVHRAVPGLRVLLHQFQSAVVYLLGAAAALAFYFQEWEEAGAITVVLALNTLIGFVTELKAARSIEALRTLGTHSARVRRDGHVSLIPAEEIVPGDIVLLEAGDALSADVRLLEAYNLAADESALTGESVPVDKTTCRVPADARLSEHERPVTLNEQENSNAHRELTRPSPLPRTKSNGRRSCGPNSNAHRELTRLSPLPRTEMHNGRRSRASPHIQGAAGAGLAGCGVTVTSMTIWVALAALMLVGVVGLLALLRVDPLA